MIQLKVLGSLIVLVGLLAQCGVSQRRVDNAEQRIAALRAKGVPDSSLSTAVVLLNSVKYFRQIRDNASAKKAADSMTVLIARAEALYKEKIQNLWPEIDGLMSSVKKARQNFSGIQLRKADSMIAVVDSFRSLNWIYQAEDCARKAVAMLPQLEFEENRAKEVRSRLPGRWTCTNLTTSDAHKEIKATETKIFDFFKDGKVKLVESGSGRSAINLKMDYEFHSYGNWDVGGDTVFLFINRFARVKENMEEYYDSDKEWRKKVEPPYDSLITDRSQDRWITFSDLLEDFKKTATY